MFPTRISFENHERPLWPPPEYVGCPLESAPALLFCGELCPKVYNNSDGEGYSSMKGTLNEVNFGSLFLRRVRFFSSLGTEQRTLFACKCVGGTMHAVFPSCKRPAMYIKFPDLSVTLQARRHEWTTTAIRFAVQLLCACPPRHRLYHKYASVVS